MAKARPFQFLHSQEPTEDASFAGSLQNVLYGPGVHVNISEKLYQISIGYWWRGWMAANDLDADSFEIVQALCVHFPFATTSAMQLIRQGRAAAIEAPNY